MKTTFTYLLIILFLFACKTDVKEKKASEQKTKKKPTNYCSNKYAAYTIVYNNLNDIFNSMAVTLVTLFIRFFTFDYILFILGKFIYLLFGH